MQTMSRSSKRIVLGVILLVAVIGLFHQQITQHVACAAEKSELSVVDARATKPTVDVALSPKDAVQSPKAVAASEPEVAKVPSEDHLVKVEALSAAFRQVAKKANPAVVHIIAKYALKKTEGTEQQDEDTDWETEELPEILRKFFEERGQEPRKPRRNVPIPPRQRPRERTGMGSGVIIDAENGYIVTNNHVVESSDKEEGRFDVRLADGRRFEGTVVGRDPSTDLAVMKIQAENLEALSLGDSDKMEVGDWVLAIGSPFAFEQTVTQGIISAKGRNNLGIIAGYEDFIQTDAAINPGNSGGPLLNMKGEVIGINTAIVTHGLISGPGFMGIGFAVPVKTVKQVLPYLKEGQEVVRGYLGVGIRGLDTYPPGIGKTFGLTDDAGVLVESFKPDHPDTPARQAGLKIDDVILEYNGQRVKSSTHLQSLVALTAPGTTVELTIWRDRQEIIIPVEIGRQPKNFFAQAGPWSHRSEEHEDAEPENPEVEIEVLGMTVQRLTHELAKQYGWKDVDLSEAMLVVVRLDPLGEASAGLGIAVGDLILSVQSIPVKSSQALLEALNEDALAEGVRLRIQSVRTRESSTVYLEIDR